VVFIVAQTQLSDIILHQFVSHENFSSLNLNYLITCYMSNQNAKNKINSSQHKYHGIVKYMTGNHASWCEKDP